MSLVGWQADLPFPFVEPQGVDPGT